MAFIANSDTDRTVRALDEAVARQAAYFRSIPELVAFFDAVPHVQLVLNYRREIVFANRFAVEVLQLDDPARSHGLFPGELLDCPNAHQQDCHCGTAAACATCGANRTIGFARRGEYNVQECRILQQHGNRALDLSVSGAPVTVNGEQFVVLTLTDITHEKRRQALEQVFFHDLLNVATGIVTYASVLGSAPDTESAIEIVQSIRQLVFQLTDEIKAQRELREAEGNELYVRLEPLSSSELVEQVVNAYRKHQVAHDRTLAVDPASADVKFVSDRTLLRRVLGNLVKNALEAIQPSQQVTVCCRSDAEAAEFSVHCPVVMPRDVQHQVFQRSFSTKGSGRGLGTYSVKLLTEGYLKGKAWFTSTPESGTTFFVSYPRE